MRRQNGFTLIELMIVVGIIGILATIAYPNYQDYLRKSRRVDAMGRLTTFAAAMERYYVLHNSYLGTAAGSLPSAPVNTLFNGESLDDGGNILYNFTIQTLASGSYTLRATPLGAQQQDGFLELLSSGAKQWDRNNSNAVEADEHCWEKTCS